MVNGDKDRFFNDMTIYPFYKMPNADAKKADADKCKKKRCIVAGIPSVKCCDHEMPLGITAFCGSAGSLWDTCYTPNRQ